MGIDRGLRAELAAAQAEQTLVRVRRDALDAHALDGFVVMVGRRWLVLAVLNPAMFLDGFAAVRLADITDLEWRGGSDSFVGRALALNGGWPPPPPLIGPEATADLAAWAGENSPLATIHIEVIDPDVCYIGVPVGFTSRSVVLHEITPDATWHDEPTRWNLSDITKIDWGGRYEAALAAVAPPADEIGIRLPSASA